MARILVIDDDPDVVEACRTVLEAEGHAVDSAYSREDGMAKVQNERPDAVILDVMMAQPDDGFQLAQDLRSQGNNVPILMLTSVAKVTGLEFGKNEMVPVDEFLEKPVEPEVLLQKIQSLLA